MNLTVYLIVTGIQTAAILMGVGRWQGRVETRVEGLRADLDEHKSLPAIRAHG